MNGFDDLLERLTHRLRVDPELQMEVTHELRTHLEDAAAECRAAGMTDQQAQATAVKAMGNESEIAEQLWQANRRRVRVRKVVRWTAGATLMPAAIAVSVAIAWSAMISVALLLPMVTGPWGDYGRNSIANTIANRFRQNTLAALSPESRFIIETPSDGPEVVIAKAKALAERYPNDPVYWANYAVQMIAQTPACVSPRQTLSVLDRGQEIEPANAFYPFAKAGLLLPGSCKLTEDTDNPPFEIKYVNSKGQARDLTWSTRIEILDASTFEHGLAQLREAADKPYLTSHVTDLAERRTAILPAPTRVSDVLLRAQLEEATMFAAADRDLFANAIHTAGCYAVQEAARGHGEQALQLVRDERKVSQLASRGAHISNELYSADAMYHSALRQEAGIYQLLDKPLEAERGLARYREYYGVFQEMFQDASREPLAQQRLRQTGVVDLYAAQFADPAKVNLSPGRRADYAVLDRLGLSALLIVMSIAGALPAIGAAARRLRTGRWPAIAFMGWRRLARVTVIATLAPLAVYAIYAHFTPLGGRGYGTLASAERIAVEYAAVACAVIVLLRVLSDAALRKRAVELGTDQLVRQAPGKGMTVVGTLLAAAIALYLVAWHAAAAKFQWSDGSPTAGWGILLSIAVVSYGLTWTANTDGCKEGGRGGWWRYIPAWVGWTATAAAVGTAGWRLWGKPLDHDHAMLFTMVSHAIALSLGTATVALTVVMTILARRRQSVSAGNTSVFSYRLSVAPAILLASLLLATVTAMPLRLQEKRAVAAMEAPGGSYSPGHQIDLGYWRTVQDRLDKLAARDAN